MIDDQTGNCVFFKKRSKKNLRQKKNSSSSEEGETVVKPKLKRHMNSSLFQQTSRFSSDRSNLSDNDENNTTQNDDLDELGKVSYKASRSTESIIDKDRLATASLEIDTDFSQDAQAIFERAQNINKQQDLNIGRNLYKGINNYTQYVEKKDTVMGNASSGFNRKGPMRAPSNIRATVRWDYQPDICKDYKETGFCSFGDSCKFLHDRSDYKHGWQIEQELSEGIYGIDGDDNRYEILRNSSEDEMEDIPFKCMLCREDFKDPIVTICKHYFCSECALKRYRKTARCYACTQDTKGSFKFVKNLLSRIAQLRNKYKNQSAEGNDSDDGDSGNNNDNDKVNYSVTVSNTTDDGNDNCDIQCKHHGSCSHTSVNSNDNANDLYQKFTNSPGDNNNEEQNINTLNNLNSGSCRSPGTNKVKLPASKEPNWAKPELVEYCDSDEESD